eukprot:XP_001704546.1 Hypothetical protein GL50803_31886 [Giardia lamblia ATCC 50803]
MGRHASPAWPGTTSPRARARRVTRRSPSAASAWFQRAQSSPYVWSMTTPPKSPPSRRGPSLASPSAWSSSSAVWRVCWFGFSSSERRPGFHRSTSSLSLQAPIKIVTALETTAVSFISFHHVILCLASWRIGV